MRYFALACDYDGTIAKDGQVDKKTLRALQDVKASGRRLILVTGRELDDLLAVFPGIETFDLVVAENGAVVYEPASRGVQLVSPPVDEALFQELRKRKVEPLRRGRVIVATWEPNETAVLHAIRDLNLELQVVFNKGAVMVLPSGVNKASGLAHALKRLQISPHNVVGVGDAENDHAFLSMCEVSVAVANALPQVKETADYTSRWHHGAGVRDVIRRLIKDDLQSLARTSKRNGLVLGTDARGKPLRVPAYGVNLLFAGSSGGGKSTLAKVFLEQLHERRYQFCVIDPEGDYEDFEAGVVLGDRSRVPSSLEVTQVLADAEQNAVVNLLGLPLKERPTFFARLLGDLTELRARTGRPHWLLIDEAHHVLPSDNVASSTSLPGALSNAGFVTVDPASVLSDALKLVGYAFTVGDSPRETMNAFARRVGERLPAAKRHKAEGRALAWERGGRLRYFEPHVSRFEHRRHRRKYAEGDVGPELSFYFRGPAGQLNLRAQNLIIFMQTSAGVDDATWQYHLRRGDYSRWFRDVIKDAELADEAAGVESRRGLSAAESRDLIRQAIEKRYTLPA